jgi:predicted SAM-dependent methyltransferase
VKWTTRLAYKLLPPHTWAQVFSDLALSRRRWRNSRRAAGRLLAGKTDLRLHLGCGPRLMPGWVNVDAFERSGLDLRWDLRDPLPCPGAVAELIYSEHFLEHLEQDAAEAFLREVARLLRPGGVLRLGVPDAGLYLRAYVEGRADFFAALPHLGGAERALETPGEVINQMFRMGGHHRYAWDYETLARTLERAGLVNVRQWGAGKASRPDLCLDDPSHAVETLYVEAEKPAG